MFAVKRLNGAFYYPHVISPSLKMEISQWLSTKEKEWQHVRKGFPDERNILQFGSSSYSYENHSIERFSSPMPRGWHYLQN